MKSIELLFIFSICCASCADNPNFAGGKNSTVNVKQVEPAPQVADSNPSEVLNKNSNPVIENDVTSSKSEPLDNSDSSAQPSIPEENKNSDVSVAVVDNSVNNDDLFSDSLNQPEVYEPVKTVVATVDQPIHQSEYHNEIACSKLDKFEFNLSIPQTQDMQSFVDKKYGTMAYGDVVESSVLRLFLGDIKGAVLPVTKFSLDDVVIMVKEQTNVIAMANTNTVSKYREIIIPDYAILIYNANDKNYASGGVDSAATTKYTFNNKSVTIQGGMNKTLADLFKMGIDLVAHNNIKLDYLKEKGFVDNKGNVAFKLVLVPHGWGFVNMKVGVQKCQN